VCRAFCAGNPYWANFAFDRQGNGAAVKHLPYNALQGPRREQAIRWKVAKRQIARGVGKREEAKPQARLVTVEGGALVGLATLVQHSPRLGLVRHLQ